MANNQNTLLSTKGFYLGVAIFILGLSLMIARVVLEVNSFKQEQTQSVEKPVNTIDNNLKLLQQKLDQKIQEQELKPKAEFKQSVETGFLKVFDHNPVKNKAGIIKIVEFIDFGCSSCLVDANFANRILKNNDNIKLISKLNNTDENKQLHIANLAALTAAEQSKFFEFREKQLSSPKNDLNEIIDNLQASGISLRAFRRALTINPDFLLSNLAQDIAQAEQLNLKYYTIFINNRKFSDDPKSEYNLKDITVYLSNL